MEKKLKGGIFDVLMSLIDTVQLNTNINKLAQSIQPYISNEYSHQFSFVKKGLK